MKKIIITILAVLSISQIIGQKKRSKNFDQLRKEVHNINSEDRFLKVLDFKISDFSKEGNVSYHDEFELKNEEDILDMFGRIINARHSGKVPRSIWNDLNVGDIFWGSINADGSIDIGGYIGASPMPGGNAYDLDIGSGYRSEKNSYASSGYGQNKESSIGSRDPNDPLGSIVNDGFHGVPGQGHASLGGDTWYVEASRSSYKHSDGNGVTTYIHHTSSVSNDSGWHSETDKQYVGNPDGSYVTTVNTVHTAADGSTKTSHQTYTKDAEGNKKTIITFTKTDADGNVIVEKTTEKEGSTANPMDSIKEGNEPPGPAEIQMAVYRAVTSNSLAGGNTGDANDPINGAGRNVNGNGVIKINNGAKHGYFEPKVKGGELKKSNRKTNTINPGRVNRN